ncbi:hypothetical protein C2G38_2315111, partial [Gigaspora rosea]
MPLLNVKGHYIPIDDRKTPSTSKPIKPVYTISIQEHLKHILNNPRLIAKMYFGRGIESQEKSELWHVDIWQRSSLYGDASIIINDIKYDVGQFVEFIYTNNKNQHERRFGRVEAIISFLPPSDSDNPNNQMQDGLKMSRLLRHDELGIYCSQNRSQRGHRKLWMIEEDYQIIPLNHILRHVSIWLEDTPPPVFYDFQVSEILYRDAITKRIQIRPVKFRHHHPSEYIIAPNPPPLRDMKLFKF